VLSEAILDTDESGKSIEERSKFFEERVPLPLEATNSRKNAEIRCTKHWSSDEEQAGNRNEAEASVFISSMIYD
jgi:hypothetical protein